MWVTFPDQMVSDNAPVLPSKLESSGVGKEPLRIIHNESTRYSPGNALGAESEHRHAFRVSS